MQTSRWIFLKTGAIEPVDTYEIKKQLKNVLRDGLKIIMKEVCKLKPTKTSENQMSSPRGLVEVSHDTSSASWKSREWT